MLDGYRRLVDDVDDDEADADAATADRAMSDAARLTDEDARDSIARDLGSTLFVSAGAGSGKTTELVRRVVALVSAGTAIESIAAITFTEKAADELRQRVRLALLEQAADDGDGVVQERCRTALDDLDQAALCTLHAFAQRILTAYPVEAGLPPALSVLDEIASELDFDQRFRAFYSELLGRPELERTVVLALELGITAAHLRTVAEQLDDNWDRVQRPDGPSAGASGPRPPAARRRRTGAARGQPRARRDRQAGRLPPGLVAGLAGGGGGAGRAGRRRGRGPRRAAPQPSHPGRAASAAARWATTGYGERDGCPRRGEGPGRPHVEGSALAATFDPVIEAVLGRLGDELARFTLAEAERRSRSGRLTFHDLLVLCRRLVRTPAPRRAGARRAGAALPALLLDEYQDTDPLQLDIVVAIATPTGGGSPRARAAVLRRRPEAVAVPLPPGRHRPLPADARPWSTPTRCRSRRTSGRRRRSSHWINHVFGRLIPTSRRTTGILAQPDYRGAGRRARAAS